MTYEPGELCILHDRAGDPDGMYVYVSIDRPALSPPADADAMTATHELYADFYTGIVSYE
jgi:hypothetical protein